MLLTLTALAFVNAPLAVPVTTPPVAGRLVKFAPLIEGKAPVSFEAVKVEILASATVPVNSPAGKEVKFAPDPLNPVEVNNPLEGL